ncbi:hypothetical protein JQX13_22880 [Archangium violaceum]|uniref:hypothetical protein n=1 Tax=Archangium violaceum TaxID=83451 RepID=UPI00193AE625|nr:hypothetical protein [Archangium violaceum]QRK12622.1 hypothetical protein JQX13_22880 [Archangium violaceum]
MKGLALCLGLLLAFSASANSLQLCRSFSRALAALPATMTDDAKALLTPANLAFMGTPTAAWIGSRGIPIVGEAVDVALLALGVTLQAGSWSSSSKKVPDELHHHQDGLGSRCPGIFGAVAGTLARGPDI